MKRNKGIGLMPDQKTLRATIDPESLTTIERAKLMAAEFELAVSHGRLAGYPSSAKLAATVNDLLRAFEELEAELDGPAPPGGPHDGPP